VRAATFGRVATILTPEQRSGEPGFVRRAWQKYGLIVVGNVVFFALLYFLQYRPNSQDNRATELLMIAQRDEAEGRFEAAESLYTKVVADYDDTRASAIAKERLPKVRATLKKKREVQPPLPAACAPTIDVRELLELRPTLYLSELVAGHYPLVQRAERERYFRALDDYVRLALNRDRVPLDKLRNNPVFRAGELQQRYFQVKASVRFEPDLIFDNFKLKNRGYFAIHNAVIDVTVTQDDDHEQARVRVRELQPDAEIDILEFNVNKRGGEVRVNGSIAAAEGKGQWQQRL
jgi:hypothetical protein